MMFFGLCEEVSLSNPLVALTSFYRCDSGEERLLPLEIGLELDHGWGFGAGVREP
jgi:hypothetical protein